MARCVAFFRNLNLGQGWSPTSAQLVDTFVAAGAADVDNVQANGTVVFTTGAPVRTAAAVVGALRDLTGYDDVVVVRPASFVRDLAARLAALTVAEDAQVEASFFDARRRVPCPWKSPDGRVEVLAGDHRHAVTAFHPDGRGGSSANVLLQGLTGVRVTSRGGPTILRLAHRLDRPSQH